MEILSIDPSGSVSHRHTLALPDDVIFTDLSKGNPTTNTGISITPISTNVVLASSTDVSIPG